MTSTARAQDVIVVGAGVIGLSIAWQQARLGNPVHVVDRATSGAGASGVPWGALWPTAATKNGLGHRLHRESLWQFEAFVRELEEASGLSIGFNRPGRLELLSNDSRRQAAIRESQAAQQYWPTYSNEPVQRVLTRKEALELEPAVTVEDWGALACDASACVDTGTLLAALRSSIIRQGGVIDDDSEVRDLWIDGNRVCGVVTDRPIPARSVVVAGGAWTSSIAPELAASTDIVPVKGEVIILQSKEKLFSRILKRSRTYMIPLPAGRVLVGSTSYPDAGFDSVPTEEGRDALFASAVSMVPALSSAKIESQWVGHRPQSISKSPYLGEVPGTAGLYVAGGHFKIGVAMAPVIGQLMSKILGGEPIEHDLSELQPGRPPRTSSLK
jgi:glycine oxidase